MKRKTAREKRKNVCFHHYIIITGPPQREELLRKILGGGGFLNFIKQNYTERRKTERKKEFKLTPLDHHRASTTERRNFFLEKEKIKYLLRGGYIINIYKYKY